MSASANKLNKLANSQINITTLSIQLLVIVVPSQKKLQWYLPLRRTTHFPHANFSRSINISGLYNKCDSYKLSLTCWAPQSGSLKNLPTNDRFDIESDRRWHRGVPRLTVSYWCIYYRLLLYNTVRPTRLFDCLKTKFI
jgi:hypothetical protein